MHLFQSRSSSASTPHRNGAKINYNNLSLFDGEAQSHPFYLRCQHDPPPGHSLQTSYLTNNPLPSQLAQARLPKYLLSFTKRSSPLPAPLLLPTPSQSRHQFQWDLALSPSTDGRSPSLLLVTQLGITFKPFKTTPPAATAPPPLLADAAVAALALPSIDPCTHHCPPRLLSLDPATLPSELTAGTAAFLERVRRQVPENPAAVSDPVASPLGVGDASFAHAADLIGQPGTAFVVWQGLAVSVFKALAPDREPDHPVITRFPLLPFLVAHTQGNADGSAIIPTNFVTAGRVRIVLHTDSEPFWSLVSFSVRGAHSDPLRLLQQRNTLFHHLPLRVKLIKQVLRYVHDESRIVRPLRLLLSAFAQDPPEFSSTELPLKPAFLQQLANLSLPDGLAVLIFDLLAAIVPIRPWLDHLRYIPSLSLQMSRWNTNPTKDQEVLVNFLYVSEFLLHRSSNHHHNLDPLAPRPSSSSSSSPSSSVPPPPPPLSFSSSPTSPFSAAASSSGSFLIETKLFNCLNPLTLSELIASPEGLAFVLHSTLELTVPGSWACTELLCFFAHVYAVGCVDCLGFFIHALAVAYHALHPDDWPAFTKLPFDALLALLPAPARFRVIHRFWKQQCHQEQTAAAQILTGLLNMLLTSSSFQPLLTQTMLQKAHEYAVCQGCHQTPIFGLRFRCLTCPQLDLCHHCAKPTAHLHPLDHPLVLLSRPLPLLTGFHRQSPQPPQLASNTSSSSFPICRECQTEQHSLIFRCLTCPSLYLCPSCHANNTFSALPADHLPTHLFVRLPATAFECLLHIPSLVDPILRLSSTALLPSLSSSLSSSAATTTASSSSSSHLSSYLSSWPLKRPSSLRSSTGHFDTPATTTLITHTSSPSSRFTTSLKSPPGLLRYLVYQLIRERHPATQHKLALLFHRALEEACPGTLHVGILQHPKLTRFLRRVGAHPPLHFLLMAIAVRVSQLPLGLNKATTAANYAILKPVLITLLHHPHVSLFRSKTAVLAALIVFLQSSEVPSPASSSSSSSSSSSAAPLEQTGRSFMRASLPATFLTTPRGQRPEWHLDDRDYAMILRALEPLFPQHATALCPLIVDLSRLASPETLLHNPLITRFLLTLTAVPDFLQCPLAADLDRLCQHVLSFHQGARWLWSLICTCRRDSPALTALLSALSAKITTSATSLSKFLAAVDQRVYQDFFLLLHDAVHSLIQPQSQITAASGGPLNPTPIATSTATILKLGLALLQGPTTPALRGFAELFLSGSVFSSARGGLAVPSASLVILLAELLARSPSQRLVQSQLLQPMSGLLFHAARHNERLVKPIFQHLLQLDLHQVTNHNLLLEVATVLLAHHCLDWDLSRLYHALQVAELLRFLLIPAPGDKDESRSFSPVFQQLSPLHLPGDLMILRNQITFSSPPFSAIKITVSWLYRAELFWLIEGRTVLLQQWHLDDVPYQCVHYLQLDPHIAAWELPAASQYLLRLYGGKVEITNLIVIQRPPLDQPAVPRNIVPHANLLRLISLLTRDRRACHDLLAQQLPFAAVAALVQPSHPEFVDILADTVRHAPAFQQALLQSQSIPSQRSTPGHAILGRLAAADERLYQALLAAPTDQLPHPCAVALRLRHLMGKPWTATYRLPLTPRSSVSATPTAGDREFCVASFLVFPERFEQLLASFPDLDASSALGPLRSDSPPEWGWAIQDPTLLSTLVGASAVNAAAFFRSPVFASRLSQFEATLDAGLNEWAPMSVWHALTQFCQFFTAIATSAEIKALLAHQFFDRFHTLILKMAAQASPHLDHVFELVMACCNLHPPNIQLAIDRIVLPLYAAIRTTPALAACLKFRLQRLFLAPGTCMIQPFCSQGIGLCFNLSDYGRATVPQSRFSQCFSAETSPALFQTPDNPLTSIAASVFLPLCEALTPFLPEAYEIDWLKINQVKVDGRLPLSAYLPADDGVVPWSHIVVEYRLKPCLLALGPDCSTCRLPMALTLLGSEAKSCTRCNRLSLSNQIWSCRLVCAPDNVCLDCAPLPTPSDGAKCPRCLSLLCTGAYSQTACTVCQQEVTPVDLTAKVACDCLRIRCVICFSCQAQRLGRPTPFLRQLLRSDVLQSAVQCLLDGAGLSSTQVCALTEWQRYLQMAFHLPDVEAEHIFRSSPALPHHAYLIFGLATTLPSPHILASSALVALNALLGHENRARPLDPSSTTYLRHHASASLDSALMSYGAERPKLPTMVAVDPKNTYWMQHVTLSGAMLAPAEWTFSAYQNQSTEIHHYLGLLCQLFLNLVKRASSEATVFELPDSLLRMLGPALFTDALTEVLLFADFYRSLWQLVLAICREVASQSFKQLLTTAKPALQTLSRSFARVMARVELPMEAQEFRLSQILASVLAELSPLAGPRASSASCATEKRATRKRAPVSSPRNYISHMKPLQCREFPGIAQSRASGCLGVGKRSRATLLRLHHELAVLMDALPLHVRGSIFLRFDQHDPFFMSALFIGPEFTPYSGGCFPINIRVPDDYPASPPLLELGWWFEEALCDECGLFEGPRHWGSALHSLLELLLTCQVELFPSSPYYRKHPTQVSTDEGERLHKESLTVCRSMTLRVAIIEILKSPPLEFKEIINQHFQLVGHKILEKLSKQFENIPDHQPLLFQFETLLDDLLSKQQ